MGFMYSFLMAANTIYLLIVPWMYNFIELRKKCIHISTQKPKKIPKLIIGLALDFLFTFSYQYMIIYLCYFMYSKPDYEDLVAFKWSL